MATTSPDNIYSPDSGSQYAVVQDLGALADSVQNALVSRANSYRGTSAQRNAFTTAPTGTIWSDTNGSQLVYVRRGSSWVEITPSDTGWLNLSSNLSTGFSGNLRARRHGDTVSLRGVFARTDSIPSSPFTTFTTPLSANLRPSAENAVGSMYSEGFSFIDGVSLMRTDGTLAILPRSQISSGRTVWFSVTYLV